MSLMREETRARRGDEASGPKRFGVPPRSVLIIIINTFHAERRRAALARRRLAIDPGAERERKGTADLRGYETLFPDDG